MISLATIRAEIANTLTTRPALQPSSAVLIYAAWDTLSKLYNWRGAGASLTAAEQDEIEAMIGALYADMATEILMGRFLSELIYLHSTQSYIPPGCKECDGAEYLQADYPDLMAVISTGLKNADGIHWNTPDHRGRFLVGQGAGPGLATVQTNQGGGSETATLAVTNLPAHHHTEQRYSSASGALAGVTNVADASMSAPVSAGIDTQDTGSGTPFSIIPPRRVARVFMVVSLT